MLKRYPAEAVARHADAVAHHAEAVAASRLNAHMRAPRHSCVLLCAVHVHAYVGVRVVREDSGGGYLRQGYLR